MTTLTVEKKHTAFQLGLERHGVGAVIIILYIYNVSQEHAEAWRFIRPYYLRRLSWIDTAAGQRNAETRQKRAANGQTKKRRKISKWNAFEIENSSTPQAASQAYAYVSQDEKQDLQAKANVLQDRIDRARETPQKCALLPDIDDFSDLSKKIRKRIGKERSAINGALANESRYMKHSHECGSALYALKPDYIDVRGTNVECCECLQKNTGPITAASGAGHTPKEKCETLVCSQLHWGLCRRYSKLSAVENGVWCVGSWIQTNVLGIMAVLTFDAGTSRELAYFLGGVFGKPKLGIVMVKATAPVSGRHLVHFDQSSKLPICETLHVILARWLDSHDISDVREIPVSIQRYKNTKTSLEGLQSYDESIEAWGPPTTSSIALQRPPPVRRPPRNLPFGLHMPSVRRKKTTRENVADPELHSSDSGDQTEASCETDSTSRCSITSSSDESESSSSESGCRTSSSSSFSSSECVVTGSATQLGPVANSFSLPSKKGNKLALCPVCNKSIAKNTLRFHWQIKLGTSERDKRFIHGQECVRNLLAEQTPEERHKQARMAKREVKRFLAGCISLEERAQAKQTLLDIRASM